MAGNNEHQLPTSGIKHWGLSGYSSVLPRIKFGVTGQFSSPQSPTFHTANVSNKPGKRQIQRNMEGFIKNKSREISDEFSKIGNTGAVKRFDFAVNENLFSSKYITNVDITKEGSDFYSMFKDLKEYENYPALYIFRINPLLEKNEIISLIQKVNKEHSLKIPALNFAKKNEGVLYVGKVKECFWGRLIQHLGYHKKRTSHGLQLSYWLSHTSSRPNISFSVYFFKKSTVDYLELLEKLIAKEYNPIIGKH